MNKESVSGCNIPVAERPLFVTSQSSIHSCLPLRSVWRSCKMTFLLCAASVLFAMSGKAAVLLTDKPDYYPGEYVIFTGIGWQPGEQVTIDVFETTDNPLYWVGSVSSTVYPNG